MTNRNQLLVAAATGVLGLVGSANASLIGGLYFIGTFAPDSSVATSVSDITGQTPTATFNSTLVNSGTSYNASDGSSASQLLSNIPADQATLVGNYAPVATSVMDLHGYLQVTQSGTYTFTDNNDDGGAFFINGNGTPGSGTELAENDGAHGPVLVSSTASLTAYQLIPFEYIAYNQACAGCGFTGNADGSGGGIVFFASVTGPGSVITAVPEPAFLSILSLGGVGLLARRRRA